MQIKDLSGVLATWVAILGGIIGGWAALDEYRDQGQRKLDERVLQTFSMYEHFRTSDMLAHRATFRQLDPYDPSLDYWTNYFDTVQACVEADLCNEDLVNQLFRPYAIASLDLVQCRIVAVRALEQDYDLVKEQGYGLLKIAGVAEPTCDAPQPTAEADVPPATQTPAAAPARRTQTQRPATAPTVQASTPPVTSAQTETPAEAPLARGETCPRGEICPQAGARGESGGQTGGRGERGSGGT